MGQGYLVDSNVIIDYAGSLLPESGSNLAEQIFNTYFWVSVIVKIEVLGFDHEPAKLKAMEEFIGTGIVLPLEENIVKQTILLRRKHKKLKLGDAIIAATALINNLTLITRNTKDFMNIKNLRVLNLHNL